MKKLSIFLSFLSFAVFTSAQGLQISQSNVGLGLDEVLDYDEVFITNSGPDTALVACRLEKRCYNSNDGLGVQVCWGALCFPPTNDDLNIYEDDALLVELAPGESTGAFSFHQFWVGSFGSIWRIYFYRLDNTSDEVYLDVQIDLCNEADIIISVEATVPSLKKWSVYPNPAFESLTVDYFGQGNKVQIRDLSGKIVLSEQLYNGRNKLDVSGMKSGIYVIQLFDDYHLPIKTERLVIRE